jgi:hypothetical protein
MPPVSTVRRQNSQFAERLQEIGAAAVKNFSSAAREWFKAKLSRYNFYLLPLAFVSPPRSAEGGILSSEEKRFLKFVNERSRDDQDPASPYSVAVNVEVRVVRSKSADAAPVRLTTDPTAPAVRLTEEQVRERKIPVGLRGADQEVQERYSNFKVNQDYHRLRKSLELDARYGHVRLLDPGNPNSQKKPFFNPNILQEFDKRYTPKQTPTAAGAHNVTARGGPNMKFFDFRPWILTACCDFPQSLIRIADARSREFVEGALDDEAHEEFAPLTALFPTPREAVAYILDQFPIVRRKDQERFGEYRTKRVILEIYDAMQEAMRTEWP